MNTKGMMKKLLFSTTALLALATNNMAQTPKQPGEPNNPIVQTWFTSDPAPMVHDNTMYVYTGHDEDGADFFWMQEWRIYSTKDMVNWQDHGSPLALESFRWADDRAWASQCIERNGKFYWYICAHCRQSGGMAIGVAVSDSPTGPFRDAIGKPLYTDKRWDHIDPTVVIDDEDQAWLMWGNPQIYYCKLNPDMTSIDGEVKELPMTEQAFGGPMMSQREQGKEYKDSYVEGPWLMRNEKVKPGDEKRFFLLYAAGGIPEHISYSTAPHPTGPWTYAGQLMPQSDTRSFTNHCGVADYKGHSYFFYHTGKLPGGGGFGRSTAVEEFKYNADGSFPTILPTDEGVQPVATFCPFRRVEAETMAWSKGIKTEQNEQVGVYVTDIHNGDYIKLRNVELGNKIPRTFTARVASGLRGGQIEIRIDSVRGRLLGRLDVPGTGGWEQWRTLSLDLDYSNLNDIDAPTRTINGVKLPATADLYLVFKGRKGPKLFNFDWWEMRALEQVNMPLFQTKYTADPSPLVVGDTLFLYTSHDASPEDIPDPNEKSSAGFFMYDWLLWSTTDMVNWTEHGAVASLKEFKWRTRENGAWAIQTVERNGKYYLYAPLHGHGIGVLVAPTPYGPFRDPLGEPLVWQKEHWDDIDPSVYIDDDGQAYMYWGNPQVYCIKLNDDMISTQGDIFVLNPQDGVMRPVKEEGAKINLRVAESQKASWAVKHYQEGPWLYKRGGHYYLGYATTCCPEALGYAMSDSPMGPWTWKNYIMSPTQRDRGNHPGICDFRGHSYVFGQDYDLMHLETFQHHERRSVSASEIEYNADGTIKEIPYWLDQQPMKQLSWLDPYRRVEAETMAWGFGLKSAKMGIENTGVVKDMPESTGRRNMYIFDIDDDEYIRLRGVDFGEKGARRFAISAAATGSCTVTLRLDSQDGPAIGTVNIGNTGSADKYRNFSAKVQNATGVHDLYICFSQTKGDVRLDCWSFKQ